MSAVIVPFPRNARALAMRPVAIRSAIEERARATHATAEQRRNALNMAITEYDRTGSAAWAIFAGKQELPQLQRHPYREPTPPEAA